MYQNKELNEISANTFNKYKKIIINGLKQEFNRLKKELHIEKNKKGDNKI